MKDTDPDKLPRWVAVWKKDGREVAVSHHRGFDLPTVLLNMGVWADMHRPAEHDAVTLRLKGE